MSGRTIFIRRWKLILAEVMGWRGCAFVKRWVLEAPSGRALRVHRFLPDVEEFTAHDHPWWFVTVVVRGSYVDVTSRNGTEVRRDHVTAPAIRFRNRNHEHRTITGADGAWTVLYNGPSKRNWGFWSAAGQFLPWRAYASLGMRAACESPEPQDWRTGDGVVGDVA